ncbi:MAG: NAD(P)/FAD-dependent oxidoreductase [Gallionella sp.]
MLRLTEIKLPLGHSDDDIKAAIIGRLDIAADELLSHVVFKRGTDARKHNAILYSYTLDVALRDEAAILERCKNDAHVRITPDTRYHFVAHAPADFISKVEQGGGERTTQTAQSARQGVNEEANTGPPMKWNPKRPVVVGMGPAGIFAGLLLAQMGFRPLILERGKAVRERTRDTWDLWRKGVLNPESNVQFGEGGAGTFSDGKLYSQIKDPRFLGRKVLDEFVKAGAPEEILYVSHPHIGTFKLVGMVEKMRATIQSLGGEIRFESRVDDIETADGPGSARHVTGVVLAGGERIATDHLVLAVGHSARDTFEMLHRRGIHIEPKPFSVGFRIEHPQSLIDAARYGRNAGNPQLGAADYKLVHHAKNGRTVYSFCMCPGGTVVAATSEPGRVVTNGMSQYSRNERNANSGIVVGITPEQDYPGDVLAGVEFQRRWESRGFELGGRNYCAPGQLVGDFLAGRPSTKFGGVLPSYTPGVHPTDLSTALPDYAVEAIREALPAFAKQIRGYDMADAVLTGVETRTSSPIRIRRNRDDYQSINTRGLYPSGEGAGYAGGILSAAVDGMEVAEAVALSIMRTIKK